MERGSRIGTKQRSNRPYLKKIMDSEDSDEDYVVEVDEVDELSDDLDSLVGEVLSEESWFEEVVEEEKEDGDDEENGREGGRTTVVKPKPRIVKGVSRSWKNSVIRPKKRRKVVLDDDDNDDDDEEFTLDEFENVEEEDDEDEELEEEEEESFPKSKSKKIVKTTLKRKRSVGIRRKRRSKTVRKPSKMKSKRTKNSGRILKSGGDEEFLEKVPTVNDRPRGKSARRRKRVTARSDSDTCSDSSDPEFTISEEEREQVREANLFCKTSAKNLQTSRKIQEDEAFCESKKPPVRKGKEKAVESKNDTGKSVCGICLTEERKSSVRGTLNCCSHYFCFGCIMEWSKVETRCPLCKQRFVTISKPTKCGKVSDLRNATVTVRERDQVYQPSEEEIRNFFNPYENVICFECHHGGDDGLMLLCDVCDSPAHTYCVGLGREVPEGNWYCDGCRPAVLTSSRSQFTGAPDRSSTYENMAEIDLNVTIPETPLNQGDEFHSSPRFAGGSLPSPVSGIGVSTVSGRRRMHNQMRNMLSNRTSQTRGVISSLGDMAGLGVSSTFHPSRTDVGTSHHVEQFGRFHENYPRGVQNTNLGPGRVGNMTGHVGQSLTAGAGVSLNHCAWSGLDHMHMETTQARFSASYPLQPCISGPNVGTNGSGFFSEDREEELRTNFVKQEVRSIVRNQVMSMSRDMNLGHSICLEILRTSEHTIMVAFGLEPRRHDTFIVQAPMCTHLLDRSAYVEISPLAAVCLACFQDFVKVIVKRILDMVMARHWQDFRH